ncbi:hypothetical protein [Leptospirillum ferriphilum]|jgi:hypothetical protein|uniref:Uncharacterized protein n=1 Tax=Leptospirillum ferriphilum (strain ML-04) TaxID=1048260 RepID=J9ZAX5_LEPFM|nr:hypothetical protein [Leptospirillum ferriphilum]AFS52837.1 hypothetical protein LFML04_0601 [Leptospirillum ferriphilum ML-04]
MEETYIILLRMIDIAEKAGLNPARLMEKIAIILEKDPKIPPEILEKVNFAEASVQFLMSIHRKSDAFETIRILLKVAKEYL